MTRDVLVVGGAIAGLAAALALHRSGRDVEVRERSDVPPPRGTALLVWPDVVDALDRLGVGDALRAASVPARDGALVDVRGRTIVGLGAETGARIVARGDLHRLLSDALPDGVVRTGVVVDPAHVDDADLVVAADGVHSVFRDVVAGRAVPAARLGTVAYRGVVSGACPTATETWGDDASLFGMSPLDDAHTNWFAAVRESSMPEGEITAAMLSDRFSGARAEIRSLLDRVDDDGIDRRRILDVPAFGPLVRDHLVLVGDAAHGMAPNLGRGAGEAILDCVALARVLDAGDPIPVALRRYDAARRGPTRRMVRASRLLDRLGTGSAPIALRGAVVRAAVGLASHGARVTPPMDSPADGDATRSRSAAPAGSSRTPAPKS